MATNKKDLRNEIDMQVFDCKEHGGLSVVYACLNCYYYQRQMSPEEVSPELLVYFEERTILDE